MRVALYLRRSTTDLQPDSLAAQDELLRSYARRNGHAVVATYRESKSGRFIDARSEFLRMIAEVKRGPSFEAILVRDVSRWSRADNLDEGAFYEWICRSRKIDVIFVEEAFGPDGSPYAMLMKAMKRFMAAEFVRERQLLIERANSRHAANGYWVVGQPPYGLKRVLVDDKGAVVADLAPGDRKILANQRVKLSLGADGEVDAVRRMFEMYAAGTTFKQIAAALNDAGITTSRGNAWNDAAIGYMLHNELYAGNMVYRLRRSGRRSVTRSLDPESPRVIRCENAHPAIVTRDLWLSVQRRLEQTSSRKNDAQLTDQLATHRLRWRQHLDEVEGDAEMLRGEAAAEVDDETVDAASTSLTNRLRERFHVETLDGGVLLDHLLLVKFAGSQPYARFGDLRWRFTFDELEDADVVLGLGFSPPPMVQHVETFFFRQSKLLMRHRAVNPHLNALKGQLFRRVSDEDDLFAVITRAFRYRGTRAETAFCAAARTSRKVSLTELARALGWPVSLTRSMYKRLSLRGVDLPPLKNGATAARVKVTCPHCYRARHLTPKVLAGLDTDVCFECLHRPVVKRPNPFVEICPACGARRTKSEAATAKSDAKLCGRCNRLRNVGQSAKVAR